MLVCICCLFAQCSDDNRSDLQLSGDCLVTELSLDGYSATISLTDRTLTVNVPETYDVSSMYITSLELSTGATCDFSVGEELNLTAPQMMTVVNGDVYLEWTIEVKNDEALITSFVINDTYTGVIDETEKTISVYVPESLGLTALIPTITISDGATVSPQSSIATDFTNPVTYTVTNNTATSVYTATVYAIGKPTAVYMGLASTMDELPIEEQTACKWMLSNISNSLYLSFSDFAAGSVDLSECKVIWWHYHKDGGVDGLTAFESAAPEAVAAAQDLRDYYENGGSFLFTRYATNMPAEIGAVLNSSAPNNCWGQVEDEAETVSSPWSFYITDHTDHPLFEDLLMNTSEPTAVYTCDAGYRITNSTAQWHIGSDWGGYADYDTWRTLTGAEDLAYGGDGAIVAWEFPKSGSNGGIVCIGSGCYDWYSVDDVEEYYHANIATMTSNAFNYLMSE